MTFHGPKNAGDVGDHWLRGAAKTPKRLPVRWQIQVEARKIQVEAPYVPHNLCFVCSKRQHLPYVPWV